MWLIPGRAFGRKNSSVTLMEKECYEVEVQPYRKTDYKPMFFNREVLGSFARSLYCEIN